MDRLPFYEVPLTDGNIGVVKDKDANETTNKIIDMIYKNRYYAPLLDSDGKNILDSNGVPIIGTWSYQIK